MKIISTNPAYDIKELKEKIRDIVKEFTDTNEDVHISVVYYEINFYRKPLKK